MTPDELSRHLDDLEARRCELGLEISWCMLVVYRDKSPSGERVRLLRRAGPLGEVMTCRDVGHGYDVVARFEVAALRKWLAKGRKT